MMLLGIAGFFALNAYLYKEKQGPDVTDYKNATFEIEGEQIKLGGNVRYFGNDLTTDLNGDGTPDTVFIVVSEPGGSGTFFYAVAALQQEDGNYVGSDGYFLGDRIAPQTTNLSQNPGHENVIVINYADRALGEPMSTQPSIGKSVYLKLDQNMRWAIVEPDFEGEAR